MKLLVAIQSKDRAQDLTKLLSWLGRSGFTTRLFVPEDQWKEYAAGLQNAEFEHYLNLQGFLVISQDPYEYARKNGFDLLVLVPDKIAWLRRRWLRSRTTDGEAMEFGLEVRKARLKFSSDPELRELRLPRNIKVIRL